MAGSARRGSSPPGRWYALEHHRGDLAHDHEKAGRLADVLVSIAGVELVREHVETNILRFDVPCSAAHFVDACREKGVTMLVSGAHSVRAVAHRDASMADVVRAGEVVREVLAAIAP